MIINRKIIYDLLYQGKYDELGDLCEGISKEKLNTELFNCAYDDNNIGIYFFVEYMYSKTNDEFWGHLTFEILETALCHLEGAYSIILHKYRKIVESEKNQKNLENLLIWYDCPDCGIKDDEAKQIAEELLEINPNNKCAKQILEKINKDKVISEK